MAVLVVKSLGYDKLASVDNLFPVTFTDRANIKQRGHVGLVNRLGIMVGSEEGKFHRKKVIKAEAAVTLYRLLEKVTYLRE
ncbi:S-layer homology domain-containing protein [Anaerobacillus sp. HL2]|nr:S-layer homology domain-containing protein [Anaerobacillus sp. HL2]